jgi:D-alanyl-D-alanine carboxypeptidase
LSLNATQPFYTGEHMTTGIKRLLAAFLALTISYLPAAAGPALLFDAQSAAVLYSEDVDQVWHPASLTKLMTAYLAFKALKEGKLKPDQELTVDDTAFKMPPSRLGLKVGEKISVDLALKAMVVKSANDMAVMVSEAIGGSEQGFAEMMNAEALRLGMKNTHYANASGLPDDAQLTTARDLATLTEALIKDYPEQAYLYAMTSVKIGNKEVETHNTLLKTYDGADGMKTGFICDSGYNIVASATRDGHRLIAVVLGEQSSASRNVRAAAMLDYGFQNYLWKTMFNDQTIANVPGAPTDTSTPGSIRKDVASCIEHHFKLRGRHRAGKGKDDPVPPDPTLGSDGAEGPAPASKPKAKLKPGTTASTN